MIRTLILLAAAGLAPWMVSGQPTQSAGPITVELVEYLTAPMTGAVDGERNQGSLARINALREEPGGRGRLFVNDLNGPLYIVDPDEGSFETYLDFNGARGRPGLFRRFAWLDGYATGLIAFQFDPAYADTGRFYTIHMEDPTLDVPPTPVTTGTPGLNAAGYTTTEPFHTPGTIQKETVLVEWTDTDISNATFEGRAREILRIEVNTHIHPLGDLVFNPAAREGAPDWGLLYLGSGDGGSGEGDGLMRQNPQRLDVAVGKILRIVPDLSRQVETSTISASGRYRIPDDNPFVNVDGALGEIFAVGLRNPHRLTWAIVDDDPSKSRLIANNIGLHAWETVAIVQAGANYGYSEREGNQRLTLDNAMAPLPDPDEIAWRLEEPQADVVTPHYPVLQYPHAPGGGDAISSGFLYRGSALPALAGRYVFGDISTGSLWYADYDELLAADDGRADTMAAYHRIRVRAAGTDDTADSTWPIVEEAYHARGGLDPDLPGGATVSGSGRVDLRLAEDADGELYLLSKSDGMIRRITAASVER